MTMQIHVVVPIKGEDLHEVLAEYQRYVTPGVNVTVTGIEHGPTLIESDLDIVKAGPQIVELVRDAERNGASAIVIDCFADPALFACREAVRVPVVGAAQASFAVAGMITDRFSVLGVSSRDEPFVRDQWRRYGHTDRGASVRTVEMSVEDFLRPSPLLVGRLVEASKLAIVEDGAGALVLGCTGMSQARETLQQELNAAGHTGVPIIDPAVLSIQMAELLVQCDLSHSEVTWPAVPGPTVALGGIA